MAHHIIRDSFSLLKCIDYRGIYKLSNFLTPPIFVKLQNRQNGKHWNPKFKRERKEKVLKMELPDFDKQHRNRSLSIEEMKTQLQKAGIAPYRPWYEKPMNISCLDAILDPYVPQEKDIKATIISSPGIKKVYENIGKKGKSYLALRKIRNVECDFDIPAAAETAKDIYIEAQTALAKNDENKLHELVTEKAFPELTENIKNKVIKWKYVKTLDQPRIVHIRCQDIHQKDNVFAQITVRLFSQESLAVYNRFGQLMYGDEDALKNILQYIVFEKCISNFNGTWRMHGKIIPEWSSPKEPVKRTYFLPRI